MRRALILVALLGCGTKVVDLDEPPDAAAVKGATVSCFIQPSTSGDRCLYCKGTTLEERACLKCVPYDPVSKCLRCTWTDNVALECMQCPDANGKILPDDCDRLRAEIPPSP
jgi:hypothetical protein